MLSLFQSHLRLSRPEPWLARIDNAWRAERPREERELGKYVARDYGGSDNASKRLMSVRPLPPAIPSQDSDKIPSDVTSPCCILLGPLGREEQFQSRRSTLALAVEDAKLCLSGRQCV